MIKNTHIISSLKASFGGTSECVPALADAVAESGRYAPTLVHFGASDAAVRERSGSAVQTMRLPWRIASLAPLRRVLAGTALAHIHGLWEAHCIVTGQLAAARGIPFAISAHGMLDGWAVRNKRWKKLLYSALVERPNLARAACLVALTPSEAEDYRRFGLRAPVAVIPNGVKVPDSISPRPFLERFPELADRRVVLFLGRIHYKKGVDILCRSWAATARDFPDAQLVLAGPDFERTLPGIRRLLSELHVESRVTITGMLDRTVKWSALASAHSFVLPSHSEGFSVATLEALAAGVPVIITHACRFPDVARRGCGLVVDPEVRRVEHALRDLLSLPEPDRRAMGARGRALIAASFTWSRIGEQLAAVYDWILGGQAPSCVEVHCT